MLAGYIKVDTQKWRRMWLSLSCHFKNSRVIAMTYYPERHLAKLWKLTHCKNSQTFPPQITGEFPFSISYVHAVWHIKVPPIILFFLWLVSHNKILTRDNLCKRQHLDDLSCLFCFMLEIAMI